MRTTISREDDAFELAKKFAEHRSLALGKAVSELVRRGAVDRYATREVDGLQIIDLPEDSPKVTTDHVRALEDEV